MQLLTLIVYNGSLLGKTLNRDKKNNVINDLFSHNVTILSPSSLYCINWIYTVRVTYACSTHKYVIYIFIWSHCMFCCKM